MTSIFSLAGRRAIAKKITPKTLFAFDFDGTLAPYFKDPEAVYTPEPIAALMRQLCNQCTVAVITGRSIESIRPKLHFKPHYMVGNHGITGLTYSKAMLPVARKISQVWSRQLTQFDEEVGFSQGVWLEDKIFSLTFHYRNSPNRALARRRIERAIEAMDPQPRLVRGKFVYNLVPAKLPHKGDAALKIMQLSRGKNVFFMGDDVTDEDVFRNSRPGWLTVRVGNSARSAADFCTPGFRDVERLLRLLVEASGS